MLRSRVDTEPIGMLLLWLLVQHCNISTSHPEMWLAGSWCGREKAMPVRESNGCSFLAHYSLVPLSQARSKLNLSGQATP